MKDRLIFLMAIHNHQPVGNFQDVFQKAFKDCYFPLLKEIRKHPSLKFTLHFSGPLWEYMQKHEKECWEFIQEIVASGQIELLGGGFYEPILSIIPEEDRRGQLKMMNDFLEENFGKNPRGVWLTERVWEPHLPHSLASAGIEYTLLDEEHFHYAGLKNIHAYYITEDEGFPLNIFPIDKKLRYFIPFREVEEIKAYFKEIKQRAGIAILGDDGEKFGLWPGTNQWVYKEKWLEKFFNFLEEENIQTLTFSEALDRFPPSDRVYLLPASYEEMMEWVLEPEDNEAYKRIRESIQAEARRFLRAGFFREFFLKYQESNLLHKRMLLVSQEVNQWKNEAAKKELYKSQCNDPYWHGIFGGLYLPHLRQAAFFHLLEAEKKLSLEPGWKIKDYDLDGRKEILYRGEKFNFFLKPSSGGSFTEIDYKPFSRNLLNVLSRRKESYYKIQDQKKGEGRSIHELSKDLPPQAQNLLTSDRSPRFSLLDHFLHPDLTKEDFQSLNYKEHGDFVSEEFSFEQKENRLILSRTGSVLINGERISVCIQKEIQPACDSLRIRYTIDNLSENNASFLFGSEWNFYLLPEEICSGNNELLLLKGKLSFRIFPFEEIWHFPLQTLSQSEKGYDIIHQGVCFFPLWRFSLGRGEKFSAEIVLEEKSEL